MNRRSFLAVAGVPAWLAAGPRRSGAMAQDRRLGSLRLKETAGLRRFGYPVHVRLPDQANLLEVPEDRFQLERKGREIADQFRRVKQADGKSLVELDFNNSPGHFEIEDYLIELARDSQ